MTSLDTYAISVGGSKKDNTPKLEAVTWQQFVARFARPKITRCTLDTCAKGEHVEHNEDGKPIGCKHKDAGYWIPATFTAGRKQKDVKRVSFLVVDADHLSDIGLDDTLARLAKYRYVAHATHSDRDGDRCVRILIPLSEPVVLADWKRFWVAAMTALGMPADPSCCDAGRLYYWPSRPSDADYFYEVHDGEPLDVREIARHAPAEEPRIVDSLGVDADGVVGEGQRHAMLVSTAGALRARGAGEAEILAALREANKRCSPPKGEAELRDVAKWASEQSVGETWKTNPPADPDARSEAKRTVWRIESATPKWITEPLPPREHLLTDTRTGRGAMDKTGVWLFGGPGGAGKSYCTIGLGVAVTSGTPWLGTFTVAAPGRSLIVAAEDDLNDIRRRYHATTRALNIPSSAAARFSILPIHDRVTSLVAKVGDVYTPSDDTKSLCDTLANQDPYDLIVVDPYGRIAGVSVDADNAAAAATISALAMISTAARGLVLGVAHTSLRARIAARNGAPEGSTGIRGATGQTDYARGVLRLEKDEEANVIWLSLAKANHVAPWQPVGLRRGDHGELVPIDAIDLATIAVAKSKDGRAARKEAAIAERNRLDDEAAKEAIAANPTGSPRQWRAVICAARSCGKDRALDAIERCKP